MKYKSAGQFLTLLCASTAETIKSKLNASVGGLNFSLNKQKTFEKLK